MPRRTRPSAPSAPSRAGEGLRPRVEALGTQLAERLGRVLDGLPRRPAGPQSLANTLGVTVVTGSRLLKALGQTDPVAVLQLLPGPAPLRQVVEAARAAGCPATACDSALEAVAGFDDLIRNVAGDRGSLKAMLSAWLPEERREFEAQRRQQIFKAMAELEGVSAELDLSCLVAAPGTSPGFLDVVDIKCLLGIDRIRPDATVQFGTWRLLAPEGDAAAEGGGPRVPLTLEGRPALEGLNDVRLDEYCHAPPAPFVAHAHGGHVSYSLGPTGFGPASRVDLVLAELNRGELPWRAPEDARPPFFFSIPEMPARRMVFDLLVHRDVYPGAGPSLLAYSTSGRGPARANEPGRSQDRRATLDAPEVLGSGLRRLRLAGFPRYPELVAHALGRLGWDPDDFRAYRVDQTYPMMGVQFTLAFLASGPKRVAGPSPPSA